MSNILYKELSIDEIISLVVDSELFLDDGKSGIVIDRDKNVSSNFAKNVLEANGIEIFDKCKIFDTERIGEYVGINEGNFYNDEPSVMVRTEENEIVNYKYKDLTFLDDK